MAASLGICPERVKFSFLSTPFDEASADFLDELGVAAYKIPSGEITNLPFLAHIARKQKPMIMSTGMASLAEVEAAVQTTRAEGNHQLILLQCVSNYPAAPADSNLRAMDLLARAFGVSVGYSDHTLGIEVSLAATALGACVIEKHITLDRKMPGPDHLASAEPAELRALVQWHTSSSKPPAGDGRKVAAASEKSTAAVARKSLVALRDIAPGTILTMDTIGARRPGTGLPPAYMRSLHTVGTNREDRHHRGDPVNVGHGGMSTTIIDHLARNYRARGGSVFTYFMRENSVDIITFADLLRRAAAYAERYREAGAVEGDSIIIILPHTPEMLYAFVGALLAGAIPSFLPFPSSKQDPRICTGLRSKNSSRESARACWSPMTKFYPLCIGILICRCCRCLLRRTSLPTPMPVSRCSKLLTRKLSLSFSTRREPPA